VTAARSRHLARAAYLAVDVTGDLAGVHHLLAAAREADPRADSSLATVVAAAALHLHRDGDLDTSHRLLVEGLGSASHDGSAHDGPDHETVDDALHLLQLVCTVAGRAELWVPLLRLVARIGPRVPGTVGLRPRCPDEEVDAAAGLDRVLAAVRDLDDESDPRRIVRVAAAAAHLDRGEGCRDALRRVVEDGRSGGAVTSAIDALLILASQAYHEGRWETARNLAAEALETCTDRGYELLAATARWSLALLAAARGDAATLRTLTDQLTGWSIPRGALRLVGYAAQARTLAALGRGDFEDAYRESTALTPPGDLEPRAGRALWPTLDRVEAAVRTHRMPEARAHVAAAREAGTPSPAPRLALLTAGAAAMVAPEDRAGALYEAALALPDVERWPFDLARVRLAHGEHLRRARATTAARGQLSRALETFSELGARPWVARAGTELRAAGQDRDRTGERARAGRASLTAQERTVAGLAASGMTNRQIADRLGLSRRTVDAHLYRVFPKLDITGRAALRDALDRRSG
jgi:DNA-binding CsgD family transcriptional regulator